MVLFSVSSYPNTFSCTCIPFLQRCRVHTIWRLHVADGGHGFQGRLQRKLRVGNHRAEGGGLLCGDLHGGNVNRGSQTPQGGGKSAEKTNASACTLTNRTAQVRGTDAASPSNLPKTPLCLYQLLQASRMLCLIHLYATFTTPPSPRPPLHASHLLGAHQEADRLASVAGGVDAGAGRAGRAVGGPAGRAIAAAVVLRQLPQVLQPAQAAQLEGEQRLQLQALYGAQEDHGVWRGEVEEINVPMQTRTHRGKSVTGSFCGAVGDQWGAAG